MDCLVLLASVRRTIFASDGDRGRFLASHLRGIRDILGRPGGTRWPTQDSSGYHELCRLIARLKSQATLQEIVAIDVYPEWIDLVAAFTIESFRCWQVRAVVCGDGRLTR
jgi:exportin-7